MSFKYNSWVFFYSFIIFFQNCDLFDLKKVSLNEIKKASEWSKTDQIPSYDECEVLESLEDQKECFRETLVNLIYSNLSKNELKSNDEINSELIIQIKINKNGNFSLDSIFDSNDLIGKIPNLKMNIEETIQKLPDALPAIKTNVGLFVNVKFSLPIKIKSKKSEITIDKDELPFKAKIDKIPQLKPAFREGGSVTAANSSAISDGAAALVLMMRSTAEKKGYKPLAKVLGHATQSQEASKFTTAPIGAINKLYEKVRWSGKDVDLYEINEAFAVVTMAAMRDLNLDQSIVNINGGACALGHPIGASGSRIVVTLYNALRKHNLSKGIASLCIGGGEATALAIELIAA